MIEKIDPYFEERLRRGQSHRVVRSIEIKAPELEVESNINLQNPVIEGSIKDFGWSEKSVENMIDAIESGKITVTLVGEDDILIEFRPIRQLPIQLGHVSELSIIKENLKNGKIFGSTDSDKFTYLQTVDFAVEGYMDDETNGKEYGRIFIDSANLVDKRNVYLDPESLNITDYEYGFSYCVFGGVPLSAISKVDVIKARSLPATDINASVSTGEWPDDPAQHIAKQVKRLSDYLAQRSKTV